MEIRRFECIKQLQEPERGWRVFRKGEIVEIKKTDELNAFVNCFKDRAGILITHFKEITEDAINKKYDQDYIKEKINLIEQATMLKNLNDIPAHSTKIMVKRNLLAIERELWLMPEEEYYKKYLDVALEKYTLKNQGGLELANANREVVARFEHGKTYTLNEIDSALAKQCSKYNLEEELERWWRMVD